MKSSPCLRPHIVTVAANWKWKGSRRSFSKKLNARPGNEILFEAVSVATGGYAKPGSPDIYTHAINRDKLVAQNQVMEAMMKPGLVN
jgi:hypothetical protein